jgi:hypothetical protein
MEDYSQAPPTYQYQADYQPEKQRYPNKLLITITAVLVVGLVALLVYSMLTFRVVGTNPSSRSITNLTPSLTVSFNKKLASNGLVVSGSNGIIKDSKVSGKTLTISFNYPLDASKSYTVQVASIYATSGQRITNKTYTFKPKSVSFDKLPGSQQQAIVDSQDQNQGPSADPIARYLPYGTLDFNLSATVTQGSNNQSQLVLNAQLLLSHADMSDQDAAIAQYKKEVTDYIESIGFDPSKYTINYTVVTPTE